MTDDDLFEASVLEGARQAFEPDEHAAQRVFSATERALLAAPVAPPATRPLDVLVHAPGLGLRLVTATVLSLASGIMGYHLAPSSAAPAQFVEPAAIAPASPTQRLSSATQQAPPVAPVDPLATSIEESSTRPPIMESRHRPQPRRAVAEQRDPAPSITQPPSLMHELQRLREVETALRAQNFGEAARVLNLLDQEVPEGKMMEERDAAFVVTRCALGLGDRSRLARAFAADHPGSVYWERVHSRCEADDNR